MIENDADRAALARSLMAWVEHLRHGWSVDYVPAASLAVPREPAATPPVERVAPVAAATRAADGTHVQVPAASREAQAASTEARAARREAQAASTEARAPKATLRREAKTWSPDRKLQYLRERSIGDCRRCGLCQTRSNIVFGVGSPEADVMFVGEAPGADEDRQGEPFVGRAGQRLDLWLTELGLSRQSVYIANVLKCRPPGNRDPRPEEVDRCSPFLQAQIRAISPKVIVALGRHAGMLLSGRDDMPLRAMRSASLAYDASAREEPARSRLIPLVVTYHPAYVLRQERTPDERSAVNDTVLSDLQRALQYVSS